MTGQYSKHYMGFQKYRKSWWKFFKGEDCP